MSTVDVLIVGGGPAGLSAALTLVRQNHPLILFDTNESRAMPSLKLHGVSLADGKPPAEYFAAAHTELSAYKHFQRISAEIVEIKKSDEGPFEAKDAGGKTYKGKKVILANGVKDHFPDIEGYDQAWGKGIFHNPFAQGLQNDASNRSSGVLAIDWIAIPKFAMHLTHLLSQLTPTVTIYTHGNTGLASQLEVLVSKALARPSTVRVDSRRISRLALKSPDQSHMEIYFDDGRKTTESFLGHAARTELNGQFAKQLGLGISESGGEYLAYGPTNMTNIDGVYVAGDAMSMFKVWPNAVASGAVTAAGVAIKLQEEVWNLDPIYG